jgi:hypothetical protein
MSEPLELRRLNENEQNAIIAGLEQVAKFDKGLGWSARVLLEDDAKFVRGLFWTSKESR